MDVKWLQPELSDEQKRQLAQKLSYREVRYHTSERERQILQARGENSWHHCRPWSILVAPMGFHWKRGSWQRVLEMVQYTQEQGFYCVLQEIMDRCKEPYDALGAMRNEAIMKAKQGFEWLLYVDNDVLPERDTLVKLLRWDMPIVAPFVEEPGTGKPLHGPWRPKNVGLQQIRWCVLSMLLFRTSVFNPFPGGEFWNNAIGADEGYHFQKLWDVGHRPFLDTNILLDVMSVPTYPLATNRMTEVDAKSFWDKRREWLLQPPDRAPIDPIDYRQSNGEFMPWIPQPPPINDLYPVLRSGT